EEANYIRAREDLHPRLRGDYVLNVYKRKVETLRRQLDGKLRKQYAQAVLERLRTEQPVTVNLTIERKYMVPFLRYWRREIVERTDVQVELDFVADAEVLMTGV